MNHSLFRLFLLLALASGCASPSPLPSTPLTQEARREPVGADPASLNQRLEDLVQGDAALPPDRKTALLEILRKLSARNEEILTLMNQKKSLMVKELLSQPYRKDRMESLKRSILRLNEERARNSLQALEEMKEVLGHQDNPESVMEKVMEMGGRKRWIR